MPDREALVDDLVREALDLGAAERAAFLGRLAGSDPGLAGAVGRSLELLETQSGFLESPPIVDLREIGEFETGPPPASPAPSLELPITVGPYTLLERLGEGSASAVYRARQHMPDRDVAAKLVPLPGDEDGATDAVRRESDLLARLRHPGIAQIFEARVVTINDRPHALIAVELVERATPLDRSARGRSAREHVALVASVADAMHHAHQKGVIHRDLKPANILVDGDGRPKVIDFGIAGARDDAEDRVVRGSWRYMSPEHLDGSGATDVRSDVYSLGVVLYELLAGMPPYASAGADLSEFIRALREDRPAPIEGVDPDLGAVVARALAKRPDDRYDSMAALADDLRRWSSHRPVTARRAGAAHALRLLARRRPGPFAATTIGLAALVAITAVSLALYLRADLLRRELIVAQGEQDRQSEIAARARTELDGLQELLAQALSVNRSPVGNGAISLDFVDAVSASMDAIGTPEARRSLIDASVATLARIEREAGDDPELLAMLADTYLQLGDLNGLEWTASAEEAASGEEPYRRAAALCARLETLEPGEASTARRLALAHTRLAQTLRKLDRDEESMAEGVRAVEAAEACMERASGDLESRLTLVGALWARGDAAIRTGPPELGLSDSLRAAEVIREAASEVPPTDGAASAWAWSHYRVAAWEYRQFDRPDVALMHATIANDTHLATCARSPTNERALTSLILYCEPEIELLQLLEGEDAAIRRLVEVYDLAESVLRTGVQPGLVEPFARARLRVIATLRDAGRLGMARERAVALAEWLAGGEQASADVRREALLTAANLTLDEDPGLGRRLLDRVGGLPGVQDPEAAARIDALDRALRELGH